MRGADCGSFEHACAVSAFWTGLIYDQASLDEAYDLISDWTSDEMDQLWRNTSHSGLKTIFQGQPILEIARKLVPLAIQGLVRRNIRHEHLGDESIYLDYLLEIVGSGISPADKLVNDFKDNCAQDIDCLINKFVSQGKVMNKSQKIGSSSFL